MPSGTPSLPLQADVMTFQGMIAVLQNYWAQQGCIVQQPHDMEVGAGTFHSSTFLHAIGPEPWSACHVQGSRRPTDGRYGENPNRLQHYYQFQVAMKPSPPEMQDIYLGSLEALGFDLAEHDVRFVEDNWESPTLGAWGLGWEVWLNGMEVTQYTYFQQCGGLPCEPVLGELAYGIERLAMYIQGVESVYDLCWGHTPAGPVSYGDVFLQNEIEQSAYNFEHADVESLFHAFDVCERECLRLLELELPLPAYEQVLRGSHSFNLLDARHAISVTERQRFILRVRTMARGVAQAYFQSREKLGFPLRRDGTEAETKTVITTDKVDASAEQSGMSATLTIELGVEELPAGSVLPLAEHLGNGLKQTLQEAGLEPGALQIYATPRRIAASIATVKAVQPDQDTQRRGPAVTAAFDADGNPTKALAGFARSCGVEIDQLERLETKKGQWMVYSARTPGKTIASVLDDALGSLIRSLPMPRRMRWSDGAEEFLRPVLWLLALHGTDIVPISALGLTAGRETRGLRTQAPTTLSVAAADDYAAVLRERGKVVADFSERRELVRQQVEREALNAGGCVDIDEALLEEVCALVEWPVALAGSFDETFLAIPKEALIQTMEENQRYFALLDKTGQLLPGFITVANLESSNPAVVREGNERVIRPRFSDTMFFWNNDLRRKLADFRDALGKVLFQEKLGSVLDKSDRLIELTGFIASQTGADPVQVKTAAQLCKCDLMSDIVNELPKMQGIAGRYYAQREGYPDAVSLALEEQYYPKQAGGALPQGDVGVALAVAEKVDTLTGIYGIGMKPTGTKDPFGLRRAALGLLRILIDKRLDLDLSSLIAESARTYADRLDADFNPQELIAYILERLRSYYQEQGVQPDVVEAVLAKGIDHPLDFDQRVHAIAQFRQTDAAESLAAAAKRIRNLLKKSAEENATAITTTVDVSLLSEGAERALAESVTTTAATIEPLYASGKYASAMEATALLREPVDAFFDDVMVMVDDEKVRDNRLALLREVGNLCSGTADLSHLQIAKSA